MPATERVLINPPARTIFDDNAIMAWRGEKFVDAIVGPLSIKWMPVGWSVWQTPQRPYRVEGDRFLVLNEGQEYSLWREGSEPQESFCPLFAAGFAEEAHRSLVRTDAALLDEPQAAAPSRLEFDEQLYEADGETLPRLRCMRRALHAGEVTQEWLEAQFHELAEGLLRARRDVRRAIDRLPARRLATRQEIHRRLQRAREYLHAHFAEQPRLDDTARAAGLSPHHFHRLFRAAFGRTPHAYLTELRLARARALLTHTERPVTEICFDLGFESLGSFSSLFRRWVGRSPAQFRRGTTTDEQG